MGKPERMFLRYFPRVEVNLHNVQETLLLPLWCRAQAALLDDVSFTDFQAVQLVRRLNYDFSKFRARIRRFYIMLLAARAKEQDEMIRSFIEKHPRAVIVNIGAGLDTSFYRVNNGTIRWYDLDVPGVIELRRILLPPNPQVCCIAKSIFDPKAFGKIAPPEDGILFLVSGVLMYFSEPEVRALFQDLTAGFPSCEIIFDALTPFGVLVANRMIRKSGISGAKICWGISAGGLRNKRFGISGKKRLPVCRTDSSCLRFGIFSAVLAFLNGVLKVYTLNVATLD